MPILARLLRRRRARHALIWMLRRQDDRMLRDIGLTRHELRQLLDIWEE